jgi:hypothetical protein
MGRAACGIAAAKAGIKKGQNGRKWANFIKYNFLPYTCNIRIAGKTKEKEHYAEESAHCGVASKSKDY